MALSPAERKIARRRFARDQFVARNVTATLNAEDIDALIEDLDAYLDTNAVTINLSIRAGVRAKATPAQKGLAMAYCAMARTGAI